MSKNRKRSFFISYNLRYQMKHKKSFFFNLFTIAVGITVYLSIQSIVITNEQEIKTNAYVKTGGCLSVTFEEGRIPDNIYGKLNKLEEEQTMTYTSAFWIQGTASAKKRNAMCVIRYIDPENYPFYKSKADSCDYTELSDMHNLILSERLASSLGVSKGDSIQLQGIESNSSTSYTVVGIAPEDGEDALDMNIYGYVFLSRESLTKMFGSVAEQAASKVYIKCTENKEKEIEKLCSKQEIQRVKEEMETIGKEVQGSSASYRGMGMFALALSFIGIISSMILMVMRRQKDICIFKIYGASNGNIAGLFLKEMLSVTLLGIAMGILMGTISSYIVCFAIHGYLCNLLLIGNFYVSLGKLIALGMVLGAISGMVPVFLTLQFKPVFVLRAQEMSGIKRKKGFQVLAAGLGVLLLGVIFSIVVGSITGGLLWILILAAIFLFYLLARFFFWLMVSTGTIGAKGKVRKIALKSLKNEKKKFSMIELVMSICVAVVALVLLMYNSILPSLETQVKNSLGYDALFKVNVQREQAVNDAIMKCGADAFYESVTVEFSLAAINQQEVEVLDDYSYSMDCMVGEVSYVNDAIIEGQGLGNNQDGIVVDQDFYDQYGMHVGDLVTLQVGGQNCDFKVSGVRKSDKIKTGQIYAVYSQVEPYVEAESLRYYVVSSHVDKFITQFNKRFEEIVVLNISDISAPYAATLNKEMMVLKLVALLCTGSALLLIFNILSITYLGKQKEFLIFGMYGADRRQKRCILVMQGLVLGMACAMLSFVISVLGAIVLEGMSGIHINYDGKTCLELVALAVGCAEVSTIVISGSLVKYADYQVLRNE